MANQLIVLIIYFSALFIVFLAFVIWAVYAIKKMDKDFKKHYKSKI